MRRPISAGLALAIYLAGALVAPWLHQRHHADHGADHQHTSAGVVAVDHAHDVSHAAMDETLAALDLAEVASAGVPAVDCELAAFTLIDCSTATPTHAVAFGDDATPARPPASDPDHGKNSLEHARAQLLASAPTIDLLPPRIAQLTHAPLALASLRSVSIPTASCRGPPSPVG